MNWSLLSKTLSVVPFFLPCLPTFAQVKSTPTPVWAPNSHFSLSTTDSQPARQGSIGSIEADRVYVDGVRYHRFKSGGLSILVPDTWKLSASDFEQAFCASRSEGSLTRERPGVRVEMNLDSEGQIQAYGELIQKTIQDKCSGGSSAPNVPIQPQLDIGVSYTPRSSKSPVKRYKAFNRDFGPNLFFGADF